MSKIDKLVQYTATALSWTSQYLAEGLMGAMVALVLVIGFRFKEPRESEANHMKYVIEFAKTRHVLPYYCKKTGKV
jgi:hypothetical protein